MGVTGVALATVLGLVESKPADAIKWALSGFSNTTVWLIFGAFMFALGYEKSGLGRRLALGLVKKMGGNSLGLGYAVMLSDVVLAPFTPSNTARSGGTIFPVIRNIPGLYGSEPGPTSRRLGGPLMWTALATTCVTSSLFLTGLAPNLLALEIVRKTAKVDISWSAWLVGFLPVGVLLLAVVPLLVGLFYAPEIRKSIDVPAWAGKELQGMGTVSRNEIVMGAPRARRPRALDLRREVHRPDGRRLRGDRAHGRSSASSPGTTSSRTSPRGTSSCGSRPSSRSRTG